MTNCKIHIRAGRNGWSDCDSFIDADTPSLNPAQHYSIPGCKFTASQLPPNTDTSQLVPIGEIVVKAPLAPEFVPIPPPTVEAQLDGIEHNYNLQVKALTENYEYLKSQADKPQRDEKRARQIMYGLDTDTDKSKKE